MDSAQTSLELLAHFDAPVGRHTPREFPIRGVTWVLRWAVALVVLVLASSVLIEFGYCLAAEHKLARAARAGALEATLPRASYQSVTQSVQRRLTSYALPTGRWRLNLAQNGAPVRGQIDPADGDRLSVTLAMPTSAVMPRWLRTAIFWRGESQITIRADRRLPSQELRMPTGG
jgi:hypothetical protein